MNWIIICLQMYTQFIILIHTLFITSISGNQIVPLVKEREEVVCTSIDVRNDASLLKKLENCTVIEGSLTIVLIDHGVWEDYKPHSYPKLVEITDYLMIFRAYGLKSLSHIFPNLAVIRGQNLFVNYALVLFEVPDIEELGLPGLTSIRRGAVRLDMNSNLCYIDTIDWKRITNVEDEDNFIFQNKDIDECANVCPKHCPRTEMQQNGAIRQQPLCWDYEHCQIYCPPECLQHGCYTVKSSQGVERRECCSKHCLGGCTGPTTRDCIACENVYYKGVCQAHCPVNTYMYQQRRCITDLECRNIPSIGENHYHWKLLESPKRECAKECPRDYMPRENDLHRCDKCKGQCPKICAGIAIDSVAAAQKIRGCTIIHGILEIRIRGGNQVGLELERSLGSIEEVSQYIQIMQSTALTSLSFFKNLRVIKGNKLYNDRYALFVLENHNLQDIWDFDNHPNLTIANGKVFFHFNRKLCLDKIDKLLTLTGLKDKTDQLDVSRQTNGDQIACNTTTIKLSIKPMPHVPYIVIISWENFHIADKRELLNWIVNYREAPERNVTMYNARDACGTDIWESKEVAPINENGNVAALLHPLKPYTQYAVYVKTYTISSASSGAMSAIQYFRTSPSEPSDARDIKVERYQSRELHISWKPPEKPNGNVTHYIVYWQAMPLDPKKFELRDYCEDRLQNYNKSKPTEKNKKNEEEDENLIKKNSTDGCTCLDDGIGENEITEEDRMFQIQFQNTLQNFVYRAKDKVMGTFIRKRRNVERKPWPSDEDVNYDMATKSTTLDKSPVDFDFEKNSTIMTTNGSANEDNADEDIEIPLEYNYNYAMVYGATEIILPALHHFQEYSIEIIACHEFEEGEDRQNTINNKLCSKRAISSARTLPDVNADAIYHNNITVDYLYPLNGTYVKIRWPEPHDPNGLIVTYDIEIRGVGRTNLKKRVYCITHKKYKEIGGFIAKELGSGNWSYRIRSTSLAGYGPWTPENFFYIEEIMTSNGPWGIIIGFIVSTLTVLTLCLIGIACYFNKKRSLPPQSALYASINPDYWGTSDVYIPDEWEVDRDKIEMIHELGQGSFGMVYEGIAKNLNGIPKQNVAIKTVTQTASIKDRIEFLNEASVMKAFNCSHVVKLLGVVSQGQPTLVIMELMASGDLKTFLRSHRPDYEGNDGQKPPTLGQILQMAGEIADGMNYLSAKKFVHRDLAARNCMVSASNVVKIGDFGMTRDIYETDYYRKGGKGLLPVRWMAPESLRDGIFSTQSDVWSYGVVLWEMATLAAQPYQGFANEQVLKFVVDGNIMEKPENCPDRLYNMMMACWKYNPKQRYTFNEIIEELVPDLHESFRDVSFFFSELNQENLEALRQNEDIEENCVTSPLKGSPLADDRLSYCGSDVGSAEDDIPSVILENKNSVSEGDQDSSHSSLSYNSQSLNKLSLPSSHNIHPSSLNRLSTNLISKEPIAYNHRTSFHSDDDINNSIINGTDVKNVLKDHCESSTVPLIVSENNTGCTKKWSNESDSSPSLPPSNEGSKGSSKSGTSSNGLNGILNGHIPRKTVANPNC